MLGKKRKCYFKKRGYKLLRINCPFIIRIIIIFRLCMVPAIIPVFEWRWNWGRSLHLKVVKFWALPTITEIYKKRSLILSYIIHNTCIFFYEKNKFSKYIYIFFFVERRKEKLNKFSYIKIEKWDPFCWGMSWNLLLIPSTIQHISFIFTPDSIQYLFELKYIIIFGFGFVVLIWKHPEGIYRIYPKTYIFPKKLNYEKHKNKTKI